ncbi:MAG: hypothetical protein AAF441_14730 [Pseudomonadota bacterium]
MPDLFEIVRHYSDLGDHRTASAADEETNAWLEDLLRQFGADVTRHRYDFERFLYDVSGTGAAADQHLDALYYCATGAHEVDNPLVTQLSFDEWHSDGHFQSALEEAASEAHRQGRNGVILATGSSASGLSQINRAPQPPGSLPICLAPGHALEEIRSGPAGFGFEARIETGTSDNLIARLGDVSSTAPSLVVTTPLSGWFACAGERGTGIAIALAVAIELSEQVPILLVMPTGHELGYLGAARFLETFDEPVRGVLHLGSCIADTGARGPQGHMWSVTNLKDQAFQGASAALAAEGISLTQAREPADPRCWLGESELWAPRLLPMLSIAGSSPHFHTREDICSNATTPEILARMKTCVLAAVRALIR